MREVRIPAFAKINLRLDILGKRPDGYHDIATLMVALRLFDTLVFRDSTTPDITLQCYHRQLSAGPDNLVWRSAKLLQDRTGGKRGAKRVSAGERGSYGNRTDRAILGIFLQALLNRALDERINRWLPFGRRRDSG